MLPSNAAFRRSVVRQIEINQARTPSERLDALCELIDAASAIAPTDADAQRRRQATASARLKDKERWREQCRKFLAAERVRPQDGVEATGRHP